jgi:peptidoglycan/xylan/chitin deacetylase (PgdA/CDA1 family)
MSRNKITLMYHAVIPDEEQGRDFYCIPVSEFRKQIEYISTVYRSQSETDVIATFDDGDVSNYTLVYPILKEFNFLAYFFITVSKVGTKGFMSWEQIKQLSDSGMIIGSHGMTHRILTELKDDELDNEIRGSKKVLEDNLGTSISYFSVPRGFYNNKIIQKAKDSGYRAVFTSNINEGGNFKLGRIPIKAHWDLEHFIRVVNKGLSFKEKTREFIKDSSKWILGAKRYDKLRTAILSK